MDVVLVPYNPDWPNRFKQVAARLSVCLGDACISIDHIGSTSVPGLASKDRIDVLISVTEISDGVKAILDQRLRDGGFQESRHADDHQPPGDTHPLAAWKKFYVSGVHPELPFRSNIHIRAIGAVNHEYALLFRDYLRATREAALGYEALKFSLAEHLAGNIDRYVAIKDPVCDIIMAGARPWAAATGWKLALAGRI